MGCIHHTTGAAGARGLMAESARTRGRASFGRPHLPVTGPSGRPYSAACFDGRPLCNTGRAAAPDESQPGREAAPPIPAIRFRTVKGQHR